MKIKSKKKLGQHFLKNKMIIKNIINTINPQYKDCLVEIGPGLGALTWPISKYINKKVITIELDKNMVDFLKKNKLFYSKIDMYNCDVMTFNFTKLAKKKKLRIFGNIPYNISTQLIFYLFKFNKCIKDIHFTFQKQVADRLTAEPGNKKYGRLSIMAQYYYNISQIFEINNEHFFPVPKVQSILVKMIPYEKKIEKYYIKTLHKIVKEAFSKRRKILSNSLKKLFSYEVLKNLSIDKLRAENVTIEKYNELVSYYKKNCINNNILKEK